MIPLLSAEQIRAWDAATIQQEPIAALDLMERASRVFSNWFSERVTPDRAVMVVAGSGNNGGDGCAVARMLHHAGYRVSLGVVRLGATGSPGFEHNLALLANIPVHTQELEAAEDLAKLTGDVFIDALFGSGLNRAPSGIALAIIQAIRGTQKPVYALDMPSGLRESGPPPGDTVLPAVATCSFEVPKAAFLLPDRGTAAGQWECRSIGLFPGAWDSDCRDFFVQAADLAGQWPERQRFSHKYQHGHVVVAGGGSGTRGAAYLAAEAALRAGAGLVSVAFPDPAKAPDFHPGLPELMHVLSDREPDLNQIGALVIGPGLGKSDEAEALLDRCLEAKASLVLDADALNLLAASSALSSIPPGSVLTPHPGEFQRLFGTLPAGRERWEAVRQAAQSTRCTVLLKGAYTVTASPEGDLWINGTGNPGMATAGSGDVLAGIIGGLLAQGLAPDHAAWLGVAWHGLAGDLVAQGQGEAGMLASDISHALPSIRQDQYAKP